MNEEHLNMEIRKFLKKVGITSQREIEKNIYNANDQGKIKIGDELSLEMTLIIKQLDTNNKIEGSIKIQ